MPTALPLIVGQRFGRWTVLGEAARSGRGRRMWLCRCDCGTTKSIEPGWLNEGSTHSCGCLRDEKTRDRIRHGFNRAADRSPEYSSWAHMIQRCTNPRNSHYRLYGGRGIRVCDRWLHSFPSFLADMGRMPFPGWSIDRIDSNGNYEPGNCRWATAQQQCRNRRGLRFISVFGETRPLIEWAEKFDINRGTLTGRLNDGWPAEKALLTPVVTNRGRAA